MIALHYLRGDGGGAMDRLARSGFYHEARRICDERELPPEALPNIEAALRHRAFMGEIQPFLRLKSRVAIGAMPQWVRHADGRIEAVGDGLSDEQRKTLAAIDALIADIARQHGLEAPLLSRKVVDGA